MCIAGFPDRRQLFINQLVVLVAGRLTHENLTALKHKVAYKQTIEKLDSSVIQCRSNNINYKISGRSIQLSEVHS